MKKLAYVALLISCHATANYIQADHPHVITPFFSTCITDNGTVTPPPVPSDVYNPNGYYDAALDQTGQTLKQALNGIISQGHIKLSYTDNSSPDAMDVWKALMITDEDPYQSDHVILLYTGRSQLNTERSGQGSLGQDNWNREHLWPKSHGGFNNSSAYAYTDIHHLRPSDESINSERGSLEFNEGGVPTKESPEAGNKKDPQRGTFEPRDAVKGDIARSMFYMATRYEGKDPITPDLEINVGNNSPTSHLGDLCTLLKWHKQDPVDDFEKQRHEKIYSIQNNRNPFIDNPFWVEEIFSSPECP